MNIDFSKLKTVDIKLAEEKAVAKAQVNALRNEKEAAGFQYLSKVFDSDERSAARIFGAVLSAQTAAALGQPFTVDWTVQDNSAVTLDGPAVIGMSTAIAQHAAALHQYASALKAQIDAAQSSTALSAIEVTSGWPV